MLIRENWGELLEPGLRTIWDKHLNNLRDFLPVIYNMETSKKAAEHSLGVGALGLMQPWEDTGNQVNYEKIYKGFPKTYMHKKYSNGMQIERELLEDDQYSEIKKRTKALAMSVYYTRQYYGALTFNEAFNASFPGPDGKPLCASDHPLSPTNSTQWKNADELTLNADNVEKVRGRMKNWTDDKGNLLAVNPDTLIVPTQLRKPALVIADSDGEPDTSDNNVNIWKGSVNVIEYDFLTDQNAWFMVDMERMKRFLVWFDRRKAQLESEKSFDTEVAKYKTVARWSSGFDDATFIYGLQQPA